MFPIINYYRVFRELLGKMTHEIDDAFSDDRVHPFGRQGASPATRATRGGLTGRCLFVRLWFSEPKRGVLSLERVKDDVMVVHGVIGTAVMELHGVIRTAVMELHLKYL